MMRKDRWIIRSVAAAGLLLAGAAVTIPGCGNGFLGLEDYQRDLLGGLAAALLIQPAPGGAGQPVPGADGLNCWDLNGNGEGDPVEDTNGDGEFDARDCQGDDAAAGSPGRDGTPGTSGLRCWDLNANGVGDPNEDRNSDGQFDTADCQGSDGSNGSSGSAGSSGADGADGPAFFSVFIDDFFGTPAPFSAQLPVEFIRIDEPVLDFEGKSAIGYRVAIPQGYTTGNDVTMRLMFYRTGFLEGDCFIFSVDARRLQNGSGVEVYDRDVPDPATCNGDPAAPGCGRRWVRIEQPDNNGDAAGNGESIGVFIVIDLPLNTAAGLGYPGDLSAGDLLAFELATHEADSRSYELLGVEFFESATGSATRSGGKVILSEDDVCCFDPAQAYISNTGSDNVFVVDMCSSTVVAVVDVGDDPRGIDIAPDNSRVYVANRDGGSVSVIDTATNTLAQTIDLGGSDLVSATEPYDVVVSPDGEWLYIAMKNGGSENGDGTVVVVDLPAGDVVAELILDSSASLEGIVVTPDGQKVYAAGRGSMYVVDVSAQSGPVFLGTSGAARRELVVSPDGAFVFAENNAIRTSDDEALLTGDFSGERGIAISPDGRFLYSTDENTFVRVVEITTVEGLPVTTFVENIDDAGDPQFESYGIDLTDAGDRGMVSFRGSRTVRIFDTATRTFSGPPIPMELATPGGTIFGSEPKQLVITHTSK